MGIYAFLYMHAYSECAIFQIHFKQMLSDVWRCECNSSLQLFKTAIFLALCGNSRGHLYDPKKYEAALKSYRQVQYLCFYPNQRPVLECNLNKVQCEI